VPRPSLSIYASTVYQSISRLGAREVGAFRTFNMRSLIQYTSTLQIVSGEQTNKTTNWSIVCNADPLLRRVVPILRKIKF